MMGKDSCPVVVFPSWSKNRRANVLDVSNTLMARGMVSQAASFRSMMQRPVRELEKQIVTTGKHPIDYAAEKIGVKVEWHS